MEDLLVDREHWIDVDPMTQPIGTSKQDWEKLDRTTRSIVQVFLLDSVLLNVSIEYFCSKALGEA